MSRAEPQGLPQAGIEILASLAQHRALSAEQIGTIHLPGRARRWVQKVLARLGAAGLIDHAQTGGAPQRLWFATEAGLRLLGDSGYLDAAPRRFRRAEVAGPLQAHTVAVNDAAIAFLRTARERGDEFGPLSWRHEIAHPLNRGRGERRRTLFADAVLTYVRLTEEEVFVEQRFIELDRATMSVDALAAELGRYAQLFRAKGEDGEPIWRGRYPSFPPVICVLAGARRDLLERRRDTTLALLGSDPALGSARKVSIRICLAADLAEQGPFGPIFCDLRRPGAMVDWLGVEGQG